MEPNGNLKGWSSWYSWWNAVNRKVAALALVPFLLLLAGNPAQAAPMARVITIQEADIEANSVGYPAFGAIDALPATAISLFVTAPGWVVYGLEVKPIFLATGGGRWTIEVINWNDFPVHIPANVLLLYAAPMQGLTALPRASGGFIESESAAMKSAVKIAKPKAGDVDKATAALKADIAALRSRPTDAE